MGVELQVWVIPKSRSFHPSLEQFAALANALKAANWLPAAGAEGQRTRILELLPGSEVPVSKKPTRVHERDDRPLTDAWLETLAVHEIVLGWNIDNVVEAGVEYPFQFDPYPDSGPPYFAVRMFLGNDYFYETNECVAPFDEQAMQCKCGEQMTYETGWSDVIGGSRIHHLCLRCGAEFNPSDRNSEVIEVWTGEPSVLPGGLTFRFALQVDCGKYFPHEEEEARRFKLRPEFLATWEEKIGVPSNWFSPLGEVRCLPGYPASQPPVVQFWPLPEDRVSLLPNLL